MKSFIDFILDVAKDSKLAEEFKSKVESHDHQGLAGWFKDKGYEVHADECKKILDNKDDLRSSRVGIIPW